MSDQPSRSVTTSSAPESALPPGFDPGVLDFGEEEDSGLDVRRILAAISRYKWLVVLMVLLGGGAAAAAWSFVSLEYSTTGSLWVDGQQRSQNPGDVLPIRQSGLFETTAYIELLRSVSVLMPVVEEERLYLQTDPESRPLFVSFDLSERFLSGRYTLRGLEGGGVELSHAEAGVLGRGQPGDSLGTEVGLHFVAPGELGPTQEVAFRVIPPVEAARNLGSSLSTGTDLQGNFIRVSYSGRDPERITDILNGILEQHIDVAAELKRGRLDEAQAVLEEQLVYAQDLLTSAERALENFRVRTITLPSGEATPIAPGLEITRDPVMTNFFDMQMELESVRRDRSRLQSILEQLPDSSIPVESLEAIPTAAASRELQEALNDLVGLRSQLRVLRDRYSDEYPPVQETLTRIRSISTETVPRIVRSLLQELTQQEERMAALVESAASDLSEIPTRTIEEARLRRRVATQETLYNDLRRRVENARLAAASSIPDVRILDRAVVPTSPSSDPRLLLMAGLLAGGLGLGLLGAVVLDRVDSRLRYPTQVDDELGLRILGSIPKVGKRASRRNGIPSEAVALEAFRELRIAVGFAYGSAGPLTLAITSPSEGEGKTFVSTNLAVAFADMGRSTLLIDGDTRRGDAHHVLGVSRTPGLTDYLKERSSDDIIHQTDYPHLDFMPSGFRGPETPELLASRNMVHFFGSLKRAYDVIIVDCPPLSGGGDALVLGSLTGHLAIVLRSGSTDRGLASTKIDALSRFPLRILGAVLNDTAAGGIYGYDSTYLPSYLTEVEARTNESESEGGRQLLAPGGAEDRAGKKS
mgnify:CR=1 FL=1